ncbi:phosphoadenosine phosphosulfate reductase family protein [Metabacillus niabensis]|uniref:phosphoadenosine phosphosulfate reductase domain-containing protein n=1 Tax=Metabacillus niabensis TaxID=324854 RepID=UPI0011AAC2E1
MNLYLPDKIESLINEGAIFYISHSGGKDSQAMYNLLKNIIPYNQIVVVHANLGEVEWEGVIDHIKRNIEHELNIVQSKTSFLEMVEKRGKFPSPAFRQCTSDLKRAPIFKFIRNDLKKRKATIAINCTGIRAEESSARSKKEPLFYNTKESCNKRVIRHVYNWLPIFNLTTDEIFETIRSYGQEPFWAYKKNKRLSCVFCIMGCVSDLRHGAENNPHLFKKYVELEKKIGHTMFMKKGKSIPLEEYIGKQIS